MVWPRSKRAGLLLTILAVAALSGCETNSPAQNDYCLIAVPIHDSALDTAETRAQVLRHNSDWLCRCKDDCQ